jgi:hypothetical protein
MKKNTRSLKITLDEIVSVKQALSEQIKSYKKDMDAFFKKNEIIRLENVLSRLQELYSIPERD